MLERRAFVRVVAGVSAKTAEQAAEKWPEIAPGYQPFQTPKVLNPIRKQDTKKPMANYAGFACSSSWAKWLLIASPPYLSNLP